MYCIVMYCIVLCIYIWPMYLQMFSLMIILPEPFAIVPGNHVIESLQVHEVMTGVSIGSQHHWVRAVKRK